MRFLEKLRETNTERYIAWTGSADVDLPFAGMEFGEEAGEMLGKLKKLERERRGWKGSRATVEELADEMADVLIVMDRIASASGIDLEAATTNKFNKTSEANDFPHRL